MLTADYASADVAMRPEVVGDWPAWLAAYGVTLRPDMAGVMFRWDDGEQTRLRLAGWGDEDPQVLVDGRLAVLGAVWSAAFVAAVRAGLVDGVALIESGAEVARDASRGVVFRAGPLALCREEVRDVFGLDPGGLVAVVCDSPSVVAAEAAGWARCVALREGGSAVGEAPSALPADGDGAGSSGAVDSGATESAAPTAGAGDGVVKLSGGTIIDLGGSGSGEG